MSWDQNIPNAVTYGVIGILLFLTIWKVERGWVRSLPWGGLVLWTTTNGLFVAIGRTHGVSSIQ